MEGLKACPFCGSTNVAISPYDGAKTVVCMDCLCMSAAYRGENAEANAIAAWNRRAAPKNKALTLDELRQMDESTDVEIVPLKPRLWHALKDGISTGCFETYRYEDYGKTWLAYARRPEAGKERTIV